MSAGDDAVALLDRVQKGFGHARVSHDAYDLKQAILGSVAGPETSAGMLRTLQRFAENAAVEIAQAKPEKGSKPKKPDGYKTPIFKCLADYEKCCLTHNWRVCGALVAICIAKQLIPFAPRS